MLRNFFLKHAMYIHSAVASSGIIRRAETNTKRLLGEVELPQSAREERCLHDRLLEITLEKSGIA